MPKRDPNYMRRQREQIIDAALKCFAAKGFHATSIDDIARRCRSSSGGIYVHFRSKLAIYDALAHRINSRFKENPGQGCATFDELTDLMLTELTRPNNRHLLEFALRLYADLGTDRGLRKRYEQAYEPYRDYFGTIARSDPQTRDLSPARQQELVRQIMFATAGAFLYKATLPDLDADQFGQDLKSMVSRILQGAVADAKCVTVIPRRRR